MSRAVYSTQLFSGAITVGSDKILFVVPDGYRAVVVDIQATSSDDIAYAVQPLLISCFYATGTIVRFGGPFLEFGRTYSWSGRAVVNQADLIVSSTAGTGWNVHMSGYLLTLP